MKKSTGEYKTKTFYMGEWLLVDGKNFLSMQPQYKCSVCGDIISTYYPSVVCERCGSINKYKGNAISVSMEIVD